MNIQYTFIYKLGCEQYLSIDEEFNIMCCVDVLQTVVRESKIYSKGICESHQPLPILLMFRGNHPIYIYPDNLVTTWQNR